MTGAEPACVILVHGLWMTGHELSLLARRLHRNCGFRVVRFHYRSLSDPMADHVAALHRLVLQQPEGTVHLVGHSNGGLVILRLFQRHRDLPAGRVVALGTPFAGSQVARTLVHHHLGRLLLGRNPDPGLLAGGDHWPAANPLGVIAGTRPHGIGRVLGLSEPGDGTVALAETRITGASDRLELPVTHTGMAISREVARQTGVFLAAGHFAPRPSMGCRK